MPDLLTHVLLVYGLATGLAVSSERFPRRYVPIAMAGAIIPDLSKLYLVVPGEQITALLGVPFSWLPIHRLGGTVVLAALATVAVWHSARRRIFLALLAGALTQYPLDALIRRANGLSPPYFYPLSWWHPPAGGLYLSSDLWPVLPALAVACVGYLAARQAAS